MGSRTKAWWPAILLVLVGCYERGVVPDPNAPVPKVKFDDVTKDFLEALRKGEPTTGAQDQGTPVNQDAPVQQETAEPSGEEDSEGGAVSSDAGQTQE